MSKLESIDVKPKILMGGRGTGKSHILRMLSIQSVINKIRMTKAEEANKPSEEIILKYEDYKEPYFGVYLKSTLFLPLSTTNITYLTKEQLKSLFEHLFNMQTCIAIVDALRFLINNCEDGPQGIQEIISKKLCEKAPHIIKGKTFDDIIKSFKDEIDAVIKVVKEYPWYNSFSRFEGKINFTTSPDFIIDVFEVIRNEFLDGKVLFILLDEYDELDEYQQQFINNIIRMRILSLRIASKIGGLKTLEYTKGKELDEIHDYDPIIPLHFEQSQVRKYNYRDILKNIFIKRLKIYGNYRINEPEKILPNPSLEDEGITSIELQKELENIYKDIKKKKSASKNIDQYWKNFTGHYREAALYRILRQKGKDKLYAGFDEYKSLSSGIVRQFILLCREAFLLAHNMNIVVEDGEPIPVRIQSEAATSVSSSQLLIELTKSIPSGYGPKLVRLIQDLGRILQAKLYYSTEPQSNRFEIIDSQKFVDNVNRIPKEIIENGLRMPHFISETAFKPKQPVYSLSFTFSLNGIFAPVLKIPPEKRWRTPLTVVELRDMCSDDRREETLGEIIRQIRKKARIRRGIKKLTKIKQLLITLNSTSPISLSNCPVTGYGCNQNLIKYIIQRDQLKAFLAIPFNEGWVIDPRRWIKTAFTDHFGIRCVDIDDFPHAGPILCKICSCVRQMPIGVFEFTNFNPNVIFELGMATALDKHNFIMVCKERVQENQKGKFPPKPFDALEYIPYKLGESPIIKTIEEKILPTIHELDNYEKEDWCSILNGKCTHKDISIQDKTLVCLPYNLNEEFFIEVENLLSKMLGKKITFFKPAKSISELCQLCREIRASKFCIVDTTNNDISMLFALGIAFGRDKGFIQLHNIELSPTRPISDLRSWAIEYKNIIELKSLVKTELEKRFGDHNLG